MKINEFVKVNDLEEAYNLLQSDPKNIIVGGGAWLKLTNREVHQMIDLEKLHLNKISENADSITIGSMTTLRDVELNESIRELEDGILAKAIHGIMGLNIRNLATIGGSIMGKYAFSDILTPLLVMDVQLEFYKSGKMTLSEFMSIKLPNDILMNVIIKKRKANGYFYAMKKTSLDFAVINVAITKADKIDIAIGARPSVSTKPENAIEYINSHENITIEIIEKTAKKVIEETKFGANARASKEYREDITEVYVKRGLSEVTSL